MKIHVPWNTAGPDYNLHLLMEIAALNWLLLRPSISPSVLYKLLTRTKGEKIDVKTTVATKKREILVAVLTCLDSTERLILEPDVQSS